MTTPIIDPSLFKKAYNGSVGCMCGCKGNYTYDAKSIRSRAKKAEAIFLSP